MGVVDTVEWACVLCGSCIQNDWVSRTTNLCQFLSQAWTFLCGNYLHDSEGFRDDAMKAVQIKTWHKCFEDSQESVESYPCSGKPATSRTPENVECQQAAVNTDWWLTVWELEADLGIPKTTVFKILMQDFGMKHVMAKLVPQLLLPEQKEHHAAVAIDAGRTVWGLKVPTLKGTETSLSYVQCFLDLQ